AVSIDLNRRQGNFIQGAACTDDTQCLSKICRRVDQDGKKCQQTDTRPKGDTCLVNTACVTNLCSFTSKDTQRIGPQRCCVVESTLDCEP
ncbi:21303_t:CDS:1, partial [Racocetra persica]